MLCLKIYIKNKIFSKQTETEHIQLLKNYTKFYGFIFKEYPSLDVTKCLLSSRFFNVIFNGDIKHKTFIKNFHCNCLRFAESNYPYLIGKNEN